MGNSALVRGWEKAHRTVLRLTSDAQMVLEFWRVSSRHEQRHLVAFRLQSSRTRLRMGEKKNTHELSLFR